MKKEWYWSRFADDFEAKNNYVVGKSDIMLVNDALAKIENLKTTLELACGNGTYSKILVPKAEAYHATDFSEEMLSVAKGKLKLFSNVQFSRENCFNLSYNDENFDTVFMANLLHVISEPDLVLAEAKRVMKKNSRIIIISYTMDGMNFVNKISMMYRYLKTYGKPSSTAHKMKLTDMENIVREAGFKIQKSCLIGDKCKAIFVLAEL